jgi:hypothetical protein
MEKDGSATNFKDVDWDLLPSLHIFPNDHLPEYPDCIPLFTQTLKMEVKYFFETVTKTAHLYTVTAPDQHQQKYSRMVQLCEEMWSKF